MKYLAILLILAGLTACAKDPAVSEQTNNSNFRVDTLFTHDGCTVYRFYDSGRSIHYAKCGLDSNTQETISSGKTSETHNMSVSGVKR